MTQEEFLKKLRKYIPANELSDILADYSEYFSSGMDDGKTELEMAEQLGAPEMLAETILADKFGGRIPSPYKFAWRNLPRIIVFIIAGGFIWAYMWPYGAARIASYNYFSYTYYEFIICILTLLLPVICFSAADAKQYFLTDKPVSFYKLKLLLSGVPALYYLIYFIPAMVKWLEAYTRFKKYGARIDIDITLKAMSYSLSMIIAVCFSLAFALWFYCLKHKSLLIAGVYPLLGLAGSFCFLMARLSDMGDFYIILFSIIHTPIPFLVSIVYMFPMLALLKLKLKRGGARRDQ